MSNPKTIYRPPISRSMRAGYLIVRKVTPLGVANIKGFVRLDGHSFCCLKHFASTHLANLTVG